ncbi:MAG: toxin-antitoxin system HicB family antitoxin [Legionellales bacterium]|nr:toxin-antitoxin system HicB family antitoxin [Legionellales bacterium]
MHRKIAVAAKENNMSINIFTKKALEEAANSPDFFADSFKQQEK